MHTCIERWDDCETERKLIDRICFWYNVLKRIRDGELMVAKSGKPPKSKQGDATTWRLFRKGAI